MENMGLADFWKGRRVFVTGQSGFKGAWLCLWLERLGAQVTAVALPPPSEPSLYALAGPWPDSYHFTDIRDRHALADHLRKSEAEIVIHMAAQALVRPSYADPDETFSTNVMGTVSVLDAVRDAPTVKTVLVVTSDKVYANDGAGRAFVESDPLGGKDPYSASKACTELVCASYAHSFMDERGVTLATARAGNVIGGGDWAQDRLVPDFIRALEQGAPLKLRYPDAVRPWQHVLEPLGGYLTYAQALTEGDGAAALPAALNFGPQAQDFATVAELADALGKGFALERAWEQAPGQWASEAPFLTLDSTLAAEALGWRPHLDRQQTVDWTVAWYRAHRDGADMRAFTERQIADYEEMMA
ncbi:MAG: CDP-glucose 4,6-dehydratase [Sphingobium sp.]|nr:CDP-glucose 4,6-dehydratase [Sphingobium sp.]